MEERDWNDPQYKAARQACFKRDGFKCIFPNCGSRTKIQCHHIERWADCPEKRFLASNLATLCGFHHRMLTNHEDEYAGLLRSILSGPDILLKTIAARINRRRLKCDE